MFIIVQLFPISDWKRLPPRQDNVNIRVNSIDIYIAWRYGSLSRARILDHPLSTLGCDSGDNVY